MQGRFFCVEQSVKTVRYLKRCAAGALVALASELVLLAIAALLISAGALAEQRMNAAVLTATALSAMLCCVSVGKKTGRRSVDACCCAGCFWLLLQLIGLLLCGALEPSRSAGSAAAVCVGAAVSLLLRGGKGRRKNGHAAVRRSRR